MFGHLDGAHLEMEPLAHWVVLEIRETMYEKLLALCLTQEHEQTYFEY